MQCSRNRDNSKKAVIALHTMKTDYDALLQASRLVDELGEAAVRISRVKLVELTAANQLRAAEFWRQVLAASEDMLSTRRGEGGGGGTMSPMRRYHR